MSLFPLLLHRHIIRTPHSICSIASSTIRFRPLLLVIPSDLHRDLPTCQSNTRRQQVLNHELGLVHFPSSNVLCYYFEFISLSDKTPNLGLLSNTTP
ncbi:hypothetical protein DTO166G4_727 [Paecilomyces variotii]|nr:hypothetical protein DTO166G4_727 [Paecilomyces variotii]KAJ9242970.1 hypothetical protein DTO166G5_74 [Paecilomyces variotii]KAJ9249173.1 hypothetical protein DTO195F2_8603 [Paecilomyces variotii]KAJ9288605.1 hypothetical protein DTO021C3_3857 [Paecilomyces variotii]KAJ9369172.1 hypothetical protein DTO282E5_6107 [Paecilomyces variotii]